MNIFNKGSKYLNNSVSVISDNTILGPVAAILLILFAVLMAPKLPSSATLFVNNIYFKIIFILILVLLAKKHFVVSLMCLIIFFIILNNKNTKNINKSPTLSSPILSPTLNYITHSPLLSVSPVINESTTDPNILPTISPIINETPIPDIPIAVALSYALSPSMRIDIINGSTMPINKDITANTASTILAASPAANNIVSQIKENFTDYINNSLNSEQTLREKSQNQTDPTISQQLLNTADKIAIYRDAVSSIINNNDVYANDQLIKSLIKSELFNDASIQALQSGDTLTAQQLNQASLSQSNVANALVQTNVLKTTAQNNSSPTESTTLFNVADAHFNASLNMINYNNNMEYALDAKFKGNHDLANQYEQKANFYLKNNLTLNNTIKGLPVKSSDKLYAKVQLPTMTTDNNNLVSNNNRCANIPAVDISGIEDNDYVRF